MKYAHFASAHVVESPVRFDNLTNGITASRLHIHQPIGELVLEVVTLAPPIALYVGRGAEFLQATSGTG